MVTVTRSGASDFDPPPVILSNRALPQEGLLVLHLEEKHHKTAYSNPMLLKCLLIQNVEGKPVPSYDFSQNGTPLQNFSGGLVNAGKT